MPQVLGTSKNISGFDPRSIVGCSLWLDGADTATMNSTPTVTTWTDKSGQGNNVVGTATYSSGTITFNGTNQAFSNTAYVFPSNAYSMFAVYSNTTAPGATSYMNVVYGNGGYPMLGVYGSSKFVSARSVVANTGALSPNIVASNVLVSATYTPSIFSPFINGSAETTLAGTTLAATGIYVGGPTNYFNGSVSEILIYSATLTQTQRQSVEGYLAWKWGINPRLPATHPFYSLPAFSRVFGPLDIPGCALWLDGADSTSMTTSSGNLLTWNDKSGNGYVMTNNTGTTIVASSSLNSLNTVYTPSGTNTKITSFTGRTKCTMFIVGKAAISRYLLALNGGFLYTANDSLLYFYPPTGNYLDLIDSVGLATPVVSNNTWFILCIGYDNATNNTANPYTINGTNRSTVIKPGGASGILSDQYITSPLYINSANGTNSYDSVYTAEIIYYNNTLTTTQRQQVEGYLAAKWGLLNNLPGKTLSPLNIPGCSLWLDGADSNSMTFSSGTSNLIAWKDKSGLSNNATAYNSPVLTANAINGNPAIATNNLPYFNGSVSVTGTTVTIFSVATTTRTLPNGGSDQRLVSLENGANVDYGRTDGVIGLFNQSSSSSIATWRVSGPLASNAITTNTPFLAVSKYDGTNAYLWKNGVAGTLASSASTGTFAVTKYGIGNQANPSGEYWQGYIGEVIIYSNALSDTERQSVENYLMSKWGISNVTSHPFKSIPPSTSQPPQFQEVTPGNWKYDWQPYLQGLAAANSSGVTVTTSTITGGATYITNGWFGAVVGLDGNVYFTPSNAANILKLNVATGVTTNITGGATYTTGGWCGGVLAPDGKIYFCPQNATNFLVLNTTTGVTSNVAGSATYTSGGWAGGLLGQDGNIYCCPLGANNILKLDPRTGVTTNITGGATYTGTGWALGQVGSDGNIYFAPVYATNYLKLNPITGVTTNVTGGATIAFNGYRGGTLGLDGNIYTAPYTDPRIMKLNTTTGVVSFITGGASMSGTAWQGGVLAADGNIYFIPNTASSLIKLNTSTNVTTNITGGATYTSQGWTCGVLAPDGNIYCSPYFSSSILKVTFSGLSQLPSLRYCVSPYPNHL